MNLQRTATIVSSSVAFILVVVKIIVWLLSWSIAVLSSAIDSLLDFWVSIFNFFALKEADKWKDIKYNYWRRKIEALASFTEWLVILASALYIFYKSIFKVFTDSEITKMDTSIYVMIFSFFVTSLLVIFLNYVYKKTWNLVIKSDALHYKTDVLANFWILVWLVVIKLTGFHIIDSIIWIIIAIYIWYSAFDLIKEGYFYLMDSALEKTEIDKIKEILDNEKWVSSYHMLQTRKSIWTNFVTVHLVFWPMTMLVDAHKISHRVEDKIKNIDTDKDWDIVAHLDPFDDEICDNFDNNLIENV